MINNGSALLIVSEVN